MSPPATPSADLLPIRVVAEATGIAPATLRIWERRYGRPQPVRLPSGHRRYTQAQLVWLRRVAEAIARGHRAASVVAATPEQLDALLEAASSETDLPPPVREILTYVRHLDEAGIVRLLEDAVRSLSATQLIDDLLVPLLRAVGRAWADGRLQVRHEHFVSQIVGDTLRALRERVIVRQRGAPLVLATLPGELHGLGLLMAAVFCDLRGVPVTHLGTDTPLDDIAAAASETAACAVLLAVSPASAGVATDAQLATLRGRLDPQVHLLVGGAAARRGRTGPRGIVYLPDFASLDHWLRDQRKEPTDALPDRRHVRR